ncbi:ATP-binding protein [Shinella sp. S4-D37]|uniref:ATP-binding protein n=1 Tax=Shinella sp. S4-D37 TaxID=3161999 RepID=UPI00346686BF
MRLAPRSLLGQLALLILGAFVTAQVMSLWLFADERGAALRAANRFETADRTAAVARALKDTTQAGAGSILAAVNSRLVRFDLGERPLVDGQGTTQETVRSRIVERLDNPLEVRVEDVFVPVHGHRPMPAPWLRERMLAAGIGPLELRISVRLAEGRWLNVRSRFERPRLQVPPVVLGTMVLSLSLLMAALWLGIRRITGPLRRLAATADAFGLDGAPPAMPPEGPREVRALCEALARMQGRLSDMIADRTRMLVALGHDLRSPITALRVRAEMVDDEETRERMVATLDEMREMVEATLAFARGVSRDQPMEETDLAALLADIAGELSETGPPVVFTGSGPAVTAVRRMPFRRALRNLMENAQRYGRGARVGVNGGGRTLEITIDDDGPGIPPGDLEHVFDPFARLETSRSRETGGIGLGLSIARAIVRAHGGEIGLSNRPEGGLRATVTLPLERNFVGIGSVNA